MVDENEPLLTSGGVPIRVSGGRQNNDSDYERLAVPSLPHDAFREHWKALIKEAVREVLAENGRNGHG